MYYPSHNTAALFLVTDVVQAVLSYLLFAAPVMNPLASLPSQQPMLAMLAMLLLTGAAVPIAPGTVPLVSNTAPVLPTIPAETCAQPELSMAA